jgi:hypothetical protein
MTMHEDCTRLLRKFLGKFVKLTVIGAHPVTEVPYKDADSQHDDRSLACGMAVRTFIAETQPSKYAITKFFKYENCHCKILIFVLII